MNMHIVCQVSLELSLLQKGRTRYALQIMANTKHFFGQIKEQNVVQQLYILMLTMG